MIDNYDHNDACYALALQFGDYRRACWFALKALRRIKARGARDDLWEVRFRETFRRRGDVSEPASI